MWQSRFLALLKDDFRRAKEKNPRFSVRGYAKRLGISPSSASALLRGAKEWNLSRRRSLAVLEKIDLSPPERNRLLLAMGEKALLKKEKLPSADYGILTDWSYYPILFSFDLPKKYRTPKNIAGRLGVKEAKVAAVVADLLDRGMLVKNTRGEIERRNVHLETSDGTANDYVRMHHEKNLELSRRALKELPAPERDFTALTFVGSKKRLAEMREKIRKLYEAAIVEMDDASGNDSVFRLSVQLFPVEFKK